MKAIIEVHFPGIQKALVREALTIFYDIREVPGLKKKPSTSELRNRGLMAALRVGMMAG